jgi:lysophospholipase L1-like esterase
MKRRLRAALGMFLIVAMTLGWLVAFQAPANATPAIALPSVGSASNYTTAPNGEMTVGCSTSGRNLKTYNQAGTVVRELDRTQTVDGVPNCILDPVVDETGGVYGIPLYRPTNQWQYGPSLLAYDGTNLRWKYPAACTSSSRPPVVIGNDGVVYSAVQTASGTRLIGLSRDAEASTLQPTKVLDVAISTGCAVDLFPYSTGIAIRSFDEPSKYVFYAYDGTYLGERNNIYGGVLGGAINASGRLFAMTSSNMQTLSAYDPDGQQVGSSYSAGAAIESIHPLPNGKVMLSVNVTGGQVLRILKEDLTEDGQDLLITQSSEDPGINYGTPRIVVTTTGKAIIVQSRENYQQGVHSTLIRTVSSSNRILSREILPDYSLSGDEPFVVKISGDKVFFQANNRDYNIILVDHTVSRAGFDYERSAMLNGTLVDLPKSYVAMGDSFSSGEGSPVFQYWTDRENQNECHRSDAAYPALLENNDGLNLDLVDFVACSGATTNNVWGFPSPGYQTGGPGLWNELPQINALADNTAVVTLTAGGNDVGFGSFAKNCVIYFCGSGTTAYTNIMNNIHNVLPTDLNELYRIILGNAPNAKLYVAGYPHMIDPANSACWTDVPANAQGAYDVTAELNETIHAAVSAIQLDSTHPQNQNRIEYVEVNSTSSIISAFAGHELCTTEPYANQLILSDTEYSFHPNTLGQAAYMLEFEASID